MKAEEKEKKKGKNLPNKQTNKKKVTKRDAHVFQAVFLAAHLFLCVTWLCCPLPISNLSCQTHTHTHKKTYANTLDPV